MEFETQRSTLSLPSKNATEPTNVNFAQSEIGEVVNGADGSTEAAQPSELTDNREQDLQAKPSQAALSAYDAVEAAYKQCKAVWSVPGSTVEQTKWSKRSVAMISAALRVVALCIGDPNAVEQFRTLAKKEGMRDRAPNKKNLELLALQLCLPPENLKQQKEWSRLSKVVKLAVSQDIQPDGAEDWLKLRTLKAALEDERSLHDKPSGPAKRISWPISGKSFPALVDALSNKETTLFELATQELEAMLCALDGTLSRLPVSDAAAVPSPPEAGSNP